MHPDNSPTRFLGRRRFIKSAVATAATFQIVPRHVLGGTGHVPPSEKLNIGCVGVGGMMGGADVNGVSSENIHALCDVDANFLGRSAAAHPQAKKYRDFREMLDKEHKNLDGITVTGPAHWGLQLGAPLSVECIHVEGANEVTYPHYACRFEFSERPNPHVAGGKMPPVTVYWHEGNAVARFKLPEAITPDDFKGQNELFIGTKGFLATSGRGEGMRLLPKAAMEGFRKPEPVIPRSPGHYKDWIRACKGGPPACSDFNIAG